MWTRCGAPTAPSASAAGNARGYVPQGPSPPAESAAAPPEASGPAAPPPAPGTPASRQYAGPQRGPACCGLGSRQAEAVDRPDGQIMEAASSRSCGKGNRAAHWTGLTWLIKNEKRACVRETGCTPFSMLSDLKVGLPPDPPRHVSKIRLELIAQLFHVFHPLQRCLWNSFGHGGGQVHGDGHRVGHGVAAGWRDGKQIFR